MYNFSHKYSLPVYEFCLKCFNDNKRPKRIELSKFIELVGIKEPLGDWDLFYVEKELNSLDLQFSVIINTCGSMNVKTGKMRNYINIVIRDKEGKVIGYNTGLTHNTFGYIQKKVYNHPYADCRGYVLEHRLVMEEKLGRYLLPTEIVHHIDGNKENNHIDNLQLFDNIGDHTRIHMLAGLKRKYSELDGLRSKSSIILYNIMKDKKNNNVIKMDISDLRKIFKIKEKTYVNFAHLKKLVLDIAVNEINRKTDIKLTYSLIYKFRKTIAIKFRLNRKKKPEPEVCWE